MFLGHKIKSTRLKNNLTQAELSTGICTKYTISRIESKNIAPNADILARICKRLNISLNDVFSEFSNIDSYNELSILSVNDFQEAEINLLKNNFIDALNILKKYDLKNNNKNNPPILYLWKAYIDIIANKDLNDVILYLTYFSKESSKRKDNKKILFYNILGIYYSKIKNKELEGYYFEKSYQYLINLNINTIYNEASIIFSLIVSANFFITINDINKAHKLISISINLLKKNTDPYFANQIITQKLIITTKKDADYEFLIAASKAFKYLSE